MASKNAPATLEEMGDDVRRLWRQWRARGGDGIWHKVTESGFVPYAREAGVAISDSVPALVERTADGALTIRVATEAEIDAWAAESLTREPVE